ncbi:response regulator [Flavobacterium sp.]|uniref:response regulator n=1 Tax=Flavobacterium sp. TaxID=239 RepID=UPI0032678AD5
MDKKGPIIIIENNQGDNKIFKEIFLELGFSNQILYFNSGDDVYNHVKENNIKPFIIFLDIVQLNMNTEKPSKVSYKSLDKIFNCPCLFFTTFFEQCFVIDAYSEPIQSYFVKPYNYNKFKNIINTIIEYWQQTKSIKTYNQKQDSEKEFEK